MSEGVEEQLCGIMAQHWGGGTHNPEIQTFVKKYLMKRTVSNWDCFSFQPQLVATLTFLVVATEADTEADMEEACPMEEDLLAWVVSAPEVAELVEDMALEAPL